MKISRNVIFVEDGKNSWIVANTLTGSIIRIDNKAKIDLEVGSEKNLKKLSTKEFLDCVDMKILVPDNLDEANFLSYIINKDRLSPKSLTSYVAFSTACNFNCVYCNEKGQVQTKTMSENLVFRIIKWHKDKLETGDFKMCRIYLYGGEPLLCMYLIRKLLSEISKITKALKIELRIILISNGFLLTKEIFKELVEFGLQEVHVSLDGDEEIHNKRRPLKNGSGSFQQVFGNLINISNLKLPVSLICRIGFDNSNLQSISVLLDKIKQKDKNQLIEPYFGYITQTTSQIINPDSFCSQHILEDDEIAESVIWLYRESKKMGFSIPDFFTLGPCIGPTDSASVIAPDGLMYKCLDMIDCSDVVTGDIRLDEPGPIYYDFLKSEQLEHCINKTDCPFVPICGGGCIMESYLILLNYDNQKTKHNKTG